MAQTMTAYQAGGGDKRFKELKARYPTISEAGIRRMVEKAGQRALASRGKKTASELTDDQAFSYGGGNAALAELKKKSGNNYSDSYLRGQITSRGRRAIAGRGDGSLPTPTTPTTPTTEAPKNAELTIEQKQAAANAARRAGQLSNIPAPVDTTEPDVPAAAAEEPAETPPVPASEVVKPPSQRELLIKEARTKYKDSPFKQWAHANQKLAMALKPGQVGYAQVQEYLKEQSKNGKLKVQPQEEAFIKPSTRKGDMGLGANDLRGYAGSISPIG